MMTIAESVKNLPEQPGVYLMYNREDTVIYVGKAKNLKNRVSQYFRQNAAHTAKVRAMVSHVQRFEYILAATEFEALVLECNLIKHYQPYYNILLKDDKAHPYIKITMNEPYPRMILTRKIAKDDAEYFGPYLNAKVIRQTIDTLQHAFQIRSCNRRLPEDIGKSRPCLNHQIGKCSAPCNGLVSQEEYREQFRHIIDFLNGRHEHLVEKLQDEMQEAASHLLFEKAAKLRDLVDSLRHISDKQRVISTAMGNKDVLAMADGGKTVCVVLLMMREGKVVGREHYIVKNNSGETPAQLLTGFVKQYYGMTDFIPYRIVLQHEIEDAELIERWLSEKCGSKIALLTPRGENKRLVEMAEKNALEHLKLHLLHADTKKRKMNDLIYEIKQTFGLEKAPMRIECYDISNISGTDSVGACVVYENGMPKKSAYRLFNIRSVDGADDYKSMQETLYRRLENGVAGTEGFELPDLILIDGGKGHVRAAREITEFFHLDIPVFGLVKDDRHRTRGVTTEDREIQVKRTSAIFRFLTAVQDETHRFACSRFRKKHKATTLQSQLTQISGVGEAKKNRLLKQFRSVKNIREADLPALMQVVDRKTAENIYRYFHDEN